MGYCFMGGGGGGEGEGCGLCAPSAFGFSCIFNMVSNRRRKPPRQFMSQHTKHGWQQGLRSGQLLWQHTHGMKFASKFISWSSGSSFVRGPYLRQLWPLHTIYECFVVMFDVKIHVQLKIFGNWSRTCTQVLAECSLTGVRLMWG